jgi:adenylylsulfate kinase-like enzyme
MPDGEFLEIFVDTPIEVCMQRDPKGLYEKAKAGQIQNFTGIDSPYEAPESPELTLDTTSQTPEQLAEKVVAYMLENGFLGDGLDYVI